MGWGGFGLWGAARGSLGLLLLQLVVLLRNGAAAAPQVAAAVLEDARSTAPLLFNVSLDSPPERRWEPVLSHFDPEFLRAAAERIISEAVPKWVHTVLRPLAEELDHFVPQPFAGEIRGMCNSLGMNVGDLVLLNLAYESTAFCTSIIAQDNNGNIYHGRNLDYEFGDILSELTVDVDFLQDEKVLFKGTTFLGYVGLWTGQRPYKFTISGDERDVGAWWENAVAAFLNRNSPVSWLVRTTLSEAEDFESAALMLAKTPIIASVYYIIGGTTPREGAVITRKRTGPLDIWPLDPSAGGWYRVETNYDHWKNPPPSDDRRTPAIKALNATGQKNINLESLYKVLSVKPVLNKYTVYTTVMSAAFPHNYTTRIRSLEWKKKIIQSQSKACCCLKCRAKCCPPNQCVSPGSGVVGEGEVFLNKREGAVITRKRTGPLDIWPLDPSAGGWYRVETNYDHWKNPPPSDDRRTPAIKALNATGQKNINLESLYKVLSVKPVLNKYTVYTTVMSAAFPHNYTTRIRSLEWKKKMKQKRNEETKDFL